MMAIPIRLVLNAVILLDDAANMLVSLDSEVDYSTRLDLRVRCRAVAHELSCALGGEQIPVEGVEE